MSEVARDCITRDSGSRNRTGETNATKRNEEKSNQAFEFRLGLNQRPQPIKLLLNH
jgi:hypothetical protein